jgi:hypothetical protein
VKDYLMKLLLAGFISLLAVSAMAQPDNKPTNGTELRSAQAEVSKPDNVPAGGCMPIGLTARGDLVFPMQCRELIERERGPVPEQQLHLPEQRTQQEPSAKATPAERDVAATGQTPAGQIPIGQAPGAQIPSDQTQTGQLQAGEILTGLTHQRGHKKLSRAERRAKQGLPPEPAPQVTGSITRN